MGTFKKKADYNVKDLEEAVKYYMGLYAQFRGNMPESVGAVASTYGVPESTLYGRVSRARKNFDEKLVTALMSPSREEEPESDESEAEGYSLVAEPKKASKGDLWQHLAEEQRKSAVLLLRKEYGSFQTDSLEVKLKLLDTIKECLSEWPTAKQLMKKLQKCSMDLTTLVEGGDDVAKSLQRDVNQLNRVLINYCSSKALRELSSAMREVEELMASQFGLPYGTSGERAKEKEIVARTELAEANAKKVKGDSSFDYAKLISGE